MGLPFRHLQDPLQAASRAMQGAITVGCDFMRRIQSGQHAQAGVVLQEAVQLVGTDAARAWAPGRFRRIEQARRENRTKKQQQEESAKNQLQQDMPMHRHATRGRVGPLACIGNQ